MQIDMHYYGTLAMAYSAGLSISDAQVIATTSQNVDDNNLTHVYQLNSGEAIQGIATAHHPIDSGVRALHWTKEDDTRLIWVPFHFLPGNEGESYGERLICRKNSKVARCMMDYYTRPETIEAHRRHGLYLMGVAAHVYADTFSHFGFSGISSIWNSVDTTSIKLEEDLNPRTRAYITSKARDFEQEFNGSNEFGFPDIVDWLAAYASHKTKLGLGHGDVATYPDRPYLRWSYVRVDGELVQRDNSKTYLECCEELHRYFSKFQKIYDPDSASHFVQFEEMRKTIESLLQLQVNANERGQAWVQALKAGKLGPAVSHVSEYIENHWVHQLKAVSQLEFESDQKSGQAYQFYTAADYHRNYVLKRLLPQFGLFVA